MNRRAFLSLAAAPFVPAVTVANPLIRYHLDAHITVGLEDGLVLKHMNSPEGQRAFLRIAGKR